MKKLLQCEEVRTILLEAAWHESGSIDLLSGMESGNIYTSRMLYKYRTPHWIFPFLDFLEKKGYIKTGRGQGHWTFEILPKGKDLVTPHSPPFS